MSNLNNWLTPKQENAIFRLAWDKHLDSESLSMRRFSKKVADLTRIEASTLIDYMQDCEPEPLPEPLPLPSPAEEILSALAPATANRERVAYSNGYADGYRARVKEEAEQGAKPAEVVKPDIDGECFCHFCAGTKKDYEEVA